MSHKYVSGAATFSRFINSHAFAANYFRTLYFVNLDSERVAFDSSKRYLEKQVSIRPPDATDVI